MKQAKYELRRTLIHDHYFVLIAPNGKIIAMSEMYNTKQAAKKGIASVQKNAGTTIIKG